MCIGVSDLCLQGLEREHLVLGFSNVNMHRNHPGAVLRESEELGM